MYYTDPSKLLEALRDGNTRSESNIYVIISFNCLWCGLEAGLFTLGSSIIVAWGPTPPGGLSMPGFSRLEKLICTHKSAGSMAPSGFRKTILMMKVAIRMLIQIWSCTLIFSLNRVQLPALFSTYPWLLMGSIRADPTVPHL